MREPEPPRGTAEPVAPGIRRLVAANPGPMTYHGTNTYLIDWEDGVAVLDPGPDDEGHIRDLLAQAGAPIRALLLTHGHRDHSGALAGLRAATGAPLHAWADSAFAPEIALREGDLAGPWRALHTPGHAPDHLCFIGPDGIIFSGDHVMSWSSTVVGGPGGDMAAYFRSLERLLAEEGALFLPGHGPPLPEPGRFTRALLWHRREREQMILDSLAERPAMTAELVVALYRGLDPALARAAEANVVAHLRKLADEHRIVEAEGTWRLVAEG